MNRARKELYEMIHLPPEIIKELEMIGGEMDIGQVESYLVQMTDIQTKTDLQPETDIRTAEQAYRQLKAYLQEDADQLKMLYCQLECAGRIWDKYQEKHIGKTVYIDTMKCFTRFIDECKRKNGRMFFDRGWWTYRQISMNIFRIGALEYQFREYDGRRVIGLHIPSDADLSEESVDDSLDQAELFFKTFYSGYKYDQYTCNSWLMSPVLRPLLSQESNILSFQNRFDIIRENRDDKEYIEWLFQVPADTEYESLPAATSLQKKVKELLLSGESVGSAFGVMSI